MEVNRYVLFKVNCTSILESIPFYEELGFAPMGAASVYSDPWIGELYACPGLVLRVQPMARRDEQGRLALELLQWEGGAWHDLAHAQPGIAILAFASSDIQAVRRGLIRAGGSSAGDAIRIPVPDGHRHLVHVRDPNGLIFQLAETERSGGGEA